MKKASRITKQSGVVLVISLIMLILMTLIAFTGFKTTGLEEKMASNLRDQNIAFQAAEATLRDAEEDIRSSGRISGITGMSSNCTNGLCYGGLNGIDTIWNNTALVANAASYGDHTSATDLNDVVTQPGYLIVGKKVKVPGSAANFKYLYQITAIAQGRSSSAKAILNEIYAPF